MANRPQISSERLILRETKRAVTPSGGAAMFVSRKLIDVPGHTFRIFVTSRGEAPEQIWRDYNRRADTENRIAELKHDLGADGFRLKKFFATAAAFLMSLMLLVASFATLLIPEPFALTQAMSPDSQELRSFPNSVRYGMLHSIRMTEQLRESFRRTRRLKSFDGLGASRTAISRTRSGSQRYRVAFHPLAVLAGSPRPLRAASLV
jgi:hypothetical protein